MIAAETGWPLDRVQRYAEPPLAERSFIANVAQQAEVRRSGDPVMLSETVAIAMQRAGRSADEVEWDAWRREDGRWIVTATAPGAIATWTYDVAGRTVHALDDSARRLMGVEDAPVEIVEPVHERPHLVAVPEPEPEGSVEPETAASPARPLDSLFPTDANDTVVLPRQAPSDEPAPTKPSPAAKKPKGRRASVPSWDEILFGSPRED